MSIKKLSRKRTTPRSNLTIRMTYDRMSDDRMSSDRMGSDKMGPDRMGEMRGPGSLGGVRTPSFSTAGQSNSKKPKQ
jgi:hypothetical protein